jgi:hypothetical protein
MARPPSYEANGPPGRDPNEGLKPSKGEREKEREREKKRKRL